MDIIANQTKRRLAAGKIVLGMGVRQARTVDIAAIARSAGFDWLFIDMEHGSMDVDMAAQLASAALATGVTPLVRVPGKEHYHATRVLDSGAQGIVVPHVDTPAEAKQIASNCKYPPLGHRSVAGGQPQLGFKNLPVGATMRLVNQETLLVVMLETPAAIRNADAIAAVKGIDVLLIGTNDLCAEMGIPGQYAHKKVEEAYAAVIAACRKRRKFPGMGGVYDPPLMQRYIGMGMRFILSGFDFSFMLAGASARVKVLRAFQPARRK